MTAMMVEAALRGLVLALIVGLGLSALRVRNVPARKAAWTLVLLASLAMPFLMRWPSAAGLPARLAWTLPLRTRPAAASVAVTPQVQSVVREILPAPIARQTAPARETSLPETSTALAQDPLPAPTATVSAAPQTQAVSRRAFPWPPVERVIVWTYLAVSGILLLRLLMGVAAALRLWASAAPVPPLDVPEEGVRASSRIASPVTIGSGVVLPADYSQWDRRKLRMVLAHEKSHVRQMDFYLQLLAGIYAALFWFSPLGWWLRRTLSSLGEAIGDRAGMDAAATRAGYAQVVLEFAAMPHKQLPGVAMARSGNLSRRVESMLNEHVFRSAFAEGRRRAVASLLLIPAALFAVTALVRVPTAAAQVAPTAQQTPPAAQPTNPQPSPAQTPTTGQSNPPESQVTSTAPAAPDQQAPPAAATPPSAPAPAPGAPDGVPAPMPAPPAMAPMPPAPTAAPGKPSADLMPPPPDGGIGIGDSMGEGQSSDQMSADSRSQSQAGNGYAYSRSANGDSWAVVKGGDTSLTFSGEFNDGRQAEIEKARKAANGAPFLWFRHGGKSYIVTDPAIVARVEAMVRPIEDLGQRPSLLGQTEANLGKKQQDLTQAAQEASRLSSADAARMMAEIQAESKAAQADWNARAKADVDAELKAVQSELGPAKLAALEDQLKSVQAEVTPEKMAEVQARVQEAMKQINSAEMAGVQARLKAAEDSWNAQSVAELQAQMADLQAKLNAMQAKLAAHRGDLGREMGRFGEDRANLGEDLGAVEAEQGRFAEKMDREMSTVIGQSLANGKARPVQ